MRRRLADPALDRAVRRADEDRWLASRFAAPEVRERLIAIYALNDEIARSSEVVSQPGLGDIRLAWWRDALAELQIDEAAHAHPALRALAGAHAQTPLPHEVMQRLIEARARDLDRTRFATWAELDAYAEATAGGVMRLALAASGGVDVAMEPMLTNAALAWGYVGLLRARGAAAAPAEGSAEEMRARAEAAYARLRGVKVETSAFAALAYVALIPLYLQRLADGKREIALLRRQFALIGAAARGKL